MTETNDGGPAFYGDIRQEQNRWLDAAMSLGEPMGPRELALAALGLAIENYRVTLRDRFAMAALTAVHRDVRENPEEYRVRGCLDFQERIAEMAYSMADAMLAQRERGKEES